MECMRSRQAEEIEARARVPEREEIHA